MSDQNQPDWIEEIKDNWRSNEDSQRISNWFKINFSNSQANGFSGEGQTAILAAGRVKNAGWITIAFSVIFYLIALSQNYGIEGFAISFAGIIQGCVLLTFGAYVQARITSDKETHDLLRELVESSRQ